MSVDDAGTTDGRDRRDGSLKSLIAANVAVVRQRIRAAGGDPDRVVLVAVTKGFGLNVARAAVAAGVCDLGDNYAQDLLGKVGAFGDEVCWHYIGPVQRNKVAALAEAVDWWHSVDRLSVGEAIARRQPGAHVLVQVNATGESTKHGCPPDGTPDLVAQLRRLDLDVAGLMTIGPSGPAESARPGFRLVAHLARRLGLAELSMGMTGDLEVAIQEGATMVRIGRGVFGPRERRVSHATVGSLNGGD